MAAVAGYSYLAPSTLAGDDLTLQTSGGPAANPRFFAGFMTAPEATAVALLAVAEVARTRYYQPADPGSLDPVVTGARDRLRFESFSGCCGVYCRLDVLPSGFDGEFVGHGTTNVDVNTPLREALGRLGGGDPLRLSVGPDDLTVSTLDRSVVERKVPLPTRWLRGFAEVQVIASGFDARAQVPAVEANRFLRRLPAGSDRSVLWAVPAGRALRLTSRPVPGAVCLAGAGRLRALRPFLRFARTLRVYGPPVHPGSAPVASTWELETPALRLSVTLSPEPYRGFSGEGRALAALATDEAADDVEVLAPLLPWDPTLDISVLSERAGLPPARVRAALTQLGTAGRVGYDVAEAAYFHRVLPYDAQAVQRLNPRLAGARALVAARAVEVDRDTARVRGAEATYLVRLDAGVPVSCTCPCWARHHGERGPCKHALAVEMALRKSAVEV